MHLHWKCEISICVPFSSVTAVCVGHRWSCISSLVAPVLWTMSSLTASLHVHSLLLFSTLKADGPVDCHCFVDIYSLTGSVWGHIGACMNRCESSLTNQKWNLVHLIKYVVTVLNGSHGSSNWFQTLASFSLASWFIRSSQIDGWTSLIRKHVFGAKQK